METIPIKKESDKMCHLAKLFLPNCFKCICGIPDPARTLATKDHLCKLKSPHEMKKTTTRKQATDGYYYSILALICWLTYFFTTFVVGVQF